MAERPLAALRTGALVVGLMCALRSLGEWARLGAMGRSGTLHLPRLLAALSLTGMMPAVQAQTDAFPEQEKRAIARHGPWPQPVLRDASNRGSGHADAIALGRALFFDTRLSLRGDMACATCHQPARALGDGRDRGQGRGGHQADLSGRLDRNTPGLWNAAFGRWFGWDGGADSLWAFSLRPLTDARELAATPAHVAQLLRSDAAYACLQGNAFGALSGSATVRSSSERPAPARSTTERPVPGRASSTERVPVPAAGAADERLLVDAAKALAAFMETLVSGKSAFDDLHDALARGDAAAVGRYPADARRGLRVFAGRGQCAVCHFGPNFSNGEFHEIGIPYLLEKGRVDSGRQGGIKRVRADRYNLLGAFSDDASRASGSRTRHVAESHATFGQFKVPGLRNVELTAPYMHNGRLATLHDVVRHYSNIPEDRLHQDGEALLKPLRLSEADIDDLVAFLRTLTSRTFPVVDAGPAPGQCTPRR